METKQMRIYLFHTGDNLLDKAIKFFTRDSYRHAAISFPEFTGDETALFEASGFKGKVLKHRQEDSLKDCKVTVYKLPKPINKCFYKAESLIGKKYDFLGFFGYPLNRENPKYVYCFEFVLKILNQIPELKDYVSMVKDGSVSGNDIAKILETAGCEKEIRQYGKVQGNFKTLTK